MARTGRQPVPSFAAIAAYGDYLRFRSLPYAGGTFDQPSWLLEEMRTVHGHYQNEREKIEKHKAESAKRAASRGRRAK